MTSNAEHLDPVGDLYLLARLRGLADSHLPHPALDLAGDSSSMRGCEVRVTVTGEDVLSDRRNFVELNGVDDWVGGVHVDSGTGAVWFRRGEELVGSATLTTCTRPPQKRGPDAQRSIPGHWAVQNVFQDLRKGMI